MKPKEYTNFYHPEDSEGDNSAGAVANRKNEVISWTASEYIEHQRGAGWYVGLVVATIVLAAGAYLIQDIISAAIVIILGIIIGVYAGNKPRQMAYEVSGRGLKVGEKPYTYSQFRSFSIIHEGALSTITFYPLKRFALPISIFFDAKNESRISNLIGEHLPLEDRGPDKFDSLTRRLKI